MFRSDLLEAGLADGYLGFFFSITPIKDSEDPIVVKVDQSDVILWPLPGFKPSSSRPSSKVAADEMIAMIERLKWEFGHGSITQSEYDFLRPIAKLGLCEKSLVFRPNPKDELQLLDVKAEAEANFSVFARRNVNLSQHTIASSAELADRLAGAARSAIPIVALKAETNINFRLVEGSHVTGGPSIPGSNIFILRPKTLVFIDSRIDISCENSTLARSKLECLVAEPV